MGMLTTTALGEAFGVEVHDVDLAHPLDEPVMQAIRAALAEHSLLLFRGQADLGPESQIAFSGRLGPLENHVLSDFCLPGHPEIFVVSNIVENGRHIGAHGGSKRFHSDLAYLPEPSLGSVFRCLECPGEGGATAFASMSVAYDALPAARREWLDGRWVVFDYAWDWALHKSHRGPLSEAQKAKVAPIAHPAVVRHPETGRLSLFVQPTWCRSFEGMSEADSRPILDEICAAATRDEMTYEHRWRPDDVLVWDNRSTVHKACPFDEQGTRRLMHRTTIKGTRPLAGAAH